VAAQFLSVASDIFDDRGEYLFAEVEVPEPLGEADRLENVPTLVAEPVVDRGSSEGRGRCDENRGRVLLHASYDGCRSRVLRFKVCSGLVSDRAERSELSSDELPVGIDCAEDVGVINVVEALLALLLLPPDQPIADTEVEDGIAEREHPDELVILTIENEEP